MGRIGEVYLVSGENVTQRDVNRAATTAAGRRGPLAVSVPRALAIAASRIADMMLGLDSRSGYRAAVRLLTADWPVGRRAGIDLLDGARTRFRDGIERTVARIVAAEGGALVPKR